MSSGPFGFATKFLTNAAVDTAPVAGAGTVLVRARHDGGTYVHAASPDLAVTVIQRAGRCTFDLNAGRFAGWPRNNDWVVKAPYTPIRISNDDGYSGLTLRVPYPRLQELISDDGALPRDGDFGDLHERINHHSSIPELIGLVDASSHADFAYESLYVDGILLQLAALLLAQSSRKLPEPSAMYVRVGDARIRRAIDYLEASIADHIGMDTLAREVGLSSRQLERAFRRATGLTPHRWLMRRRLQNAKMLLAQSTRTVSDIAHASGFSSSQHLAAAFQTSMGMTPSQYRQSKRN